MSAGGLLIELDRKSLLIDAGVGTTTMVSRSAGVDGGSMLDVLAALGRVDPEDIDVLAFTHLHFDHAGWAFADGARVFPRAQYTVAAKEWLPYARRGTSGTERRRPRGTSSPSCPPAERRTRTARRR